VFPSSTVHTLTLRLLNDTFFLHLFLAEASYTKDAIPLSLLNESRSLCFALITLILSLLRGFPAWGRLAGRLRWTPRPGSGRRSALQFCSNSVPTPERISEL